jgi:hypothetical protein
MSGGGALEPGPRLIDMPEGKVQKSFVELSNLTVVEVEHEPETMAAIARGYGGRCSP